MESDSYTVKCLFGKRHGKETHALVWIDLGASSFAMSKASSDSSGEVTCMATGGSSPIGDTAFTASDLIIERASALDARIRSGSIDAEQVSMLIEAADNLKALLGDLKSDGPSLEKPVLFLSRLAGYLRAMSLPSRTPATSYAYDSGRWERTEIKGMAPHEEMEFMARVSSSKFGCEHDGRMYRMVKVGAGNSFFLCRPLPSYGREYMDWVKRNEGQFNVTADGRMFRWIVKFEGRMVEPVGSDACLLEVLDVSTGKRIFVPKDETSVEFAFV